MEYRLTPFIPPPSCLFNPDTMQPFESAAATPDEKIISLVAMGLTLSSGPEIGGPPIRVSTEKAKVLVRGWFNGPLFGLQPNAPSKEVALKPSNDSSGGDSRPTA